jgi:hypothetical protein
MEQRQQAAVSSNPPLAEKEEVRVHSATIICQQRGGNRLFYDCD